MNRHCLPALVLCALAAPALAAGSPPGGAPSSGVYPVQEGFVDAGGVLVYYQSLGRGEPLVVLHGGPGGRPATSSPTRCRRCRTTGLTSSTSPGRAPPRRRGTARAYRSETRAEEAGPDR